MRTKIFNEEVLYPAEQIVKVDRQDIALLKEQASHNPRQRIRLCAHRDVDDTLHEMLIIHAKNTYVRPHKHLGKSESFHVIEGGVDVVILDETGNVAEVIQMGDYSSGREFYYRISDPLYHTLLIRSEVLVFHETTHGPFKRSDMAFAPWAPEENDLSAREEFINKLETMVESFVSSPEDS